MAKKRDDDFFSEPFEENQSEEIPTADEVTDADVVELADEDAIDLASLGEEPDLAATADPLEEAAFAELAEPLGDVPGSDRPGSVVDLEIPEVPKDTSSLDISGSLEPVSGASTVAWASLVEATDSEDMDASASDPDFDSPSDADLLGNLAEEEHPSSMEVIDLADPVSEPVDEAEDDIPLAAPVSADESGSSLDLAELLNATPASGSDLNMFADPTSDDQMAEAVSEEAAPAEGMATEAIEPGSALHELDIPEAEAVDAEDVFGETVTMESEESPSARDIVVEVESGTDLLGGREEDLLDLNGDPVSGSGSIDLTDAEAVADDEVDLGSSGEHPAMAVEPPQYDGDSTVQLDADPEYVADDAGAEFGGEEPSSAFEAAMEDSAADALMDDAEDAETTVPFQEEPAQADDAFEPAEALQDSPPHDGYDDESTLADSDQPVDDFEAAALQEAGDSLGDEEAPFPDDDSTPADSGKGKGKPARKGGGVLAFMGGGVVGGLATVGILVGLAFGGILPGVDMGAVMGGPTTKPGGSGTGGGGLLPKPVASVEGVQKLLQTGDLSQAAETIKTMGDSGAPQDDKFLTTRGETLWLASLHSLATAKKSPTKDDLLALEDVKKAKEDLEKANTPDATFWLGQIAEWTEGPIAAKTIYESGLTKFPDQKKKFEAALNSLERPIRKKSVEGDTPPDGTEGRRPRNPLLALTTIAMQMPGQPGNQPTPPAEGNEPLAEGDDEAGVEFWHAVKLAQSHDYAEAVKALDKARDMHDRVRFTRLRKAQNPISDPTENIFLTACDELRTYWELRDKLVKSGLLNKAAKNDGAKVLQALESSAGSSKVILSVTEKLSQENYKDPNLLASVDQLLKDRNTFAAAKDKAEKQVTDVATALKAAGVPDADVVKGVLALEGAKKTEEKKVSDTLAALKTAGVNEAADPAKGVVALDAGKKAEEKKIADTLAAFKAAGITADDPIKGAQMTVEARDLAQKTLDDSLGKLVSRKYLPTGSPRTDVPKGLDKVLVDVDHPVVAAFSRVTGDLGAMTGMANKPLEKAYQDVVKTVNLSGRLAEREIEVTKLGGQLKERWTPEQMLPVWAALLQEGTSKELADRALKDAASASKDKPSAEATYVKALAERNQGQIDAARTTLTGLLQNANALPEEMRKQAKADLKALTEPTAFFMPRVLAAQAERKPAEAVALIDSALIIFPADKFAKENAALRAVKSVMQLELAANQPMEKRMPMLEQSEKDAVEAAKAGQKVEGVFALGRVAEARGDLASAEKLYRDALTALDEAIKAAGPDGAEAVRLAHPVSDVTGNRYRWALSQVVLKQLRKPGSDPIPTGGVGQPSDVKPADEQPTGMPMSWRMWLVSQIVAAPPVCADVAPQPDLPAFKVDPRVKELMDQAKKMIDAKDPRGYLLQGQAMAMMGMWTDGMRIYVMGLKQLLKDEEYAEGLKWLMDTHPLLRGAPEGVPPDLAKSELHYARGLRFYNSRRYEEAEKELREAVRLNEFDPRAGFFWGLSLLNLGKRDEGLETLRMAAVLELRLGPQAQVDVSYALERVQGPLRKVVNQARDKAAQPPGL